MGGKTSTLKSIKHIHRISNSAFNNTIFRKTDTNSNRKSNLFNYF